MPEQKVATPNGRSNGLTAHAGFITVYLLLTPAIWILLIVSGARYSPISLGESGRAADLFLAPSFLASLCQSSTADASVWTSTAMWVLMSAGMMLPTAAPYLRSYSVLAAGQPLRIDPANIRGLAAGYIAVWLLFAVGAGFLEWELARFRLLSAQGNSLSTSFSALLLLVAGLYQFSPMKAACLSRCRSPLAFFMSEWSDGFGGAIHMGLKHGRDCLGCCWALMLLAFVGGTMNLAWMVLSTGLMTLEKLPGIGRPLTKPVGTLLILGGATLLWLGFKTV
jgi:predicted metal-binding membrane protein